MKEVGVVWIEELNDVKPADIHIKVDVPLLEVGGCRHPNLGLGMTPLNGFPGGTSKAAPMVFRGDKEKVKGIASRLGIDDKHRASNALPIRKNVPDFSAFGMEGAPHVFIGRHGGSTAEPFGDGDRESGLKRLGEGREFFFPNGFQGDGR